MKNPIILFTLLSGCLWGKAADTNLFYVTDDSRFYDPAGMRMHMDPQKIEAARTNRECLPAADFLEGNWGQALGGYQLSLRFEKQIFTNGEPVLAILLLRNVTNTIVNYAALPVGYSDGPIGFEVRDSDGRNFPQHRYPLPLLMGHEFIKDVVPFAQVKFLERLDKRFDLTNDVYFVQANVRVGDLLPTTIVKPILGSNGKWKPILDSNGMVTNVYFAGRNPNPADIYTVKSAKVKIQIEDSN
jgi:hypothetical protein